MTDVLSPEGTTDRQPQHPDWASIPMRSLMAFAF